jgi:hypothetical protein
MNGSSRGWRCSSKTRRPVAKFDLARAIIAAAITLTLTVGCGGGGLKAINANFGGKYYAVTTDKAPFYKLGPQQTNGADMQLPKDTLMKLVHASLGYCKVQLPSGQLGFIAREDIHVAPPQLVAAITNPPDGSGDPFTLNASDPRLIPPPEPLPESSPIIPVEPDPLQQ